MELGKSLGSFQAISCTPVPKPKFGEVFAILKFQDMRDARHFEHTLANCRKDGNTCVTREMTTQRWTINRNCLVTGEEEDSIYKNFFKSIYYFFIHSTQLAFPSGIMQLSITLNDFITKIVEGFRVARAGGCWCQESVARRRC